MLHVILVGRLILTYNAKIVFSFYNVVHVAVDVQWKMSNQVSKLSLIGEQDSNNNVVYLIY